MSSVQSRLPAAILAGGRARRPGGADKAPSRYAAFQIPVIPVLGARIDRGNLRVSELAAELRVREVGPEVLAAYDLEGRLFANIKTPHDYVRARTWVEGNTEPPQDRITE